jgi:hypothetical protein
MLTAIITHVTAAVLIILCSPSEAYMILKSQVISENAVWDTDKPPPYLLQGSLNADGDAVLSPLIKTGPT